MSDKFHDALLAQDPAAWSRFSSMKPKEQDSEFDKFNDARRAANADGTEKGSGDKQKRARRAVRT